MNLTIGQEVAGYRILAVLGKGGMGVVYRARDAGLDRDVALKVIKPELTRDEKSVRRFQREARVLAKLKNPNIVGVHELRHTDEGFFIVMEYVDGGDLSVLLQGVPLPISKTLSITRQLLQAFEKAHSAGVIHRDIKPQNIMISSTGEVKVTDFGLAKLSSPETMITVTSGILGTMNYMSPEQLRGDELDHRTDLWSLGVVLYEMLFGCLPFDAPYGAALMYAILDQEVEIPESMRADLPSGLDSIVLNVLQKNRESRFENASSMLQAIAELGTEVSPEPTTRDVAAKPVSGAKTETEHTALRAKRRYTRRLAGGLFAVMLMVAGYFLVPIIQELIATKTESVSTLLSVVTIPHGAAITVNEQFVGETPITDYPLAPNTDSARVQIQHEGFVSIDTTLQAGILHELLLSAVSVRTEGPNIQIPPPVVTSEEDPVTTPVTEEMIAVELLIEPQEGSEMSIDGDPFQRPGLVMLSPGVHRVSFYSARYGDFEKEITVKRGEPLSLTCYFERTIGVSSGMIWGGVLDNGAIVYREDGDPETTPTEFTLGPGSHSISLMRFEHEPKLIDGASGPITITPSCVPADPYMLVFELTPQ